MAQRAVRLDAVGVQAQRRFQAGASVFVVTQVHLYATQRQVVLRLLGGQSDRAPDQIRRLRLIATLMLQDTEQVQRVGIVRSGFQMLAITLRGRVELIAAVQLQCFFQGHDVCLIGDVRTHRAGPALCRRRSRDASC
jgi:hypothetical protein